MRADYYKLRSVVWFSYEIVPSQPAREIEGSQEQAHENGFVREGGVMLPSFPPAMASACPVCDPFHVTSQASVVVVVLVGNQRERHLTLQEWEIQGLGEAEQGS